MKNAITGRLIIRAPRPTDLAAFLEYRNHPSIVEGGAIEPMGTEDARELLAKQADFDPTGAGGWFMRAIEHRQQCRMIGEVGVFLSPKTSHGDIGWIVHPDYHRMGIATEAVGAFVSSVFRELKLHRLTAACEQRNVASWRLMERIGMRREGIFRQSRQDAAGWQDEFLYALLQAEWLHNDLYS